MIYSCECGKEFYSPSSLGGHQSACKVHLEKIGKYSEWLEMTQRRAKQSSQTCAEKRRLKMEESLSNWQAEQHRCQTCNKIMKTKFGSGRFCSRACANTREKSLESRTALSNKCRGTSLSVAEYTDIVRKKPEKNIPCNICGKLFSSRGLSIHINRCKQAHNLPVYIKIGTDELDITVEELAEYRDRITTCEICGRQVEETIQSGRINIQNLCIDHEHSTNHFRGLLCQLCNRQLGWYENYRQQIDSYLTRNISK